MKRLHAKSLKHIAFATAIACIAIAAQSQKPQASPEKYICKIEFVQSCTDKGGDHEGCVAAAESVCAFAEDKDGGRKQSFKAPAGDGGPKLKRRRD